MKAEISITGGISGNFRMVRKMRNQERSKDLSFSRGFILYYKNMKEAREDMRYMYKSIKEEDSPNATISHNKDYSRVSYDASVAVLSKSNQ